MKHSIFRDLYNFDKFKGVWSCQEGTHFLNTTCEIFTFSERERKKMDSFKLGLFSLRVCVKFFLIISPFFFIHIYTLLSTKLHLTNWKHFHFCFVIGKDSHPEVWFFYNVWTFYKVWFASIYLKETLET